MSTTMRQKTFKNVKEKVQTKTNKEDDDLYNGSIEEDEEYTSPPRYNDIFSDEDQERRINLINDNNRIMIDERKSPQKFKKHLLSKRKSFTTWKNEKMNAYRAMLEKKEAKMKRKYITSKKAEYFCDISDTVIKKMKNLKIEPFNKRRTSVYPSDGEITKYVIDSIDKESGILHLYYKNKYNELVKERKQTGKIINSLLRKNNNLSDLKNELVEKMEEFNKSRNKDKIKIITEYFENLREKITNEMELENENSNESSESDDEMTMNQEKDDGQNEDENSQNEDEDE